MTVLDYDFDDDRRVALLKHGSGRATPHFDSRLGVQFDDEQRLPSAPAARLSVGLCAASARDLFTSAAARAQERSISRVAFAASGCAETGTTGSARRAAAVIIPNNGDEEQHRERSTRSGGHDPANVPTIHRSVLQISLTRWHAG